MAVAVTPSNRTETAPSSRRQAGRRGGAMAVAWGSAGSDALCLGKQGRAVTRVWGGQSQGPVTRGVVVLHGTVYGP